MRPPRATSCTPSAQPAAPGPPNAAGPQDLLDAVGLTRVARRAAGRLSGGEQQRLAVAVALANGPQLLLADEPTSQLDHRSAASVIELIQAANQDLGTTIIVVTHDPAVGTALGRTVTIRDGRVGAEGARRRGLPGRLPRRLRPAAQRGARAALPPGSLARAVPTADGVQLHRVNREGR
jgi:ABC-type multidrug transport system ATPase subunit